jgi:hypothetical protein
MTLKDKMSGVKMPFSHDTEVSLAETVALVHAIELDGATLVPLAALTTSWPAIPPPASFIGPTRNSNPCVLCGLDSANSGQ